jgi:two-component system NtrC family sensor kinase
MPPRFAEIVAEGFRPHTAFARLVRGERFSHIHDLAEVVAQSPVDQLQRAVVEIGGVGTQLLVPMRKDHNLLGIITANRNEIRPFSDKQIALLQNFAAQAVIAMENARLLAETREALEQQTATAEVLQVINASPGDLAPVFDAMLEKAIRLCESSFGALRRFDGKMFWAIAFRDASNAPAEIAHKPVVPDPGSASERIVQGESVVHIPDLVDTEEYRSGVVSRLNAVEKLGARTGLWVALRKDDLLVGDFFIYRKEVRPFSGKQIALLQNFAAQAVIAMENARLLTETREALEQQTATAEVLQVINSSPGDLGAVFDAMLDKVLLLCDANFGNFWLRDGDSFRAAAVRGASEEYREFLTREPMRPGAGTGFGRMISERNIVHIADLEEGEAYRLREPLRVASVELGGVRTFLAVPLLKESELVGAFVITRREVHPFSDRQIALVKNFAAQAVIAIDNARLLTETREALEQQTATAEVLQVINSSPGDLAPVFDAMLEKATRLCEAPFGILRTWDGERFHFGAVHGDPQFCDWVRQRGPIRTDTDASLLGRIQAGERVVHITDAQTDEAYRVSAGFREMAEASSIRSAITVALHKDHALLGLITVYRQEVRPFSDKQITLLENFAAQAVIAIENARLLEEIRQRQAELRVTFDNMADGVAMFDEDLRLAAWNRNFQQIADLPEALLAERPSYSDYLRILTERGELDILRIDDELSRRLEDTDKELRLERTRPNGRVIEVRRNAVPDGGFVLIYSDITERKRSEAEIHAARDAAEAAYRDLKAAQANLIQAEKMASLGQLTAGIAHEIKNPLNFVNNFAGLSVELLDELKETAAPAITALDEVSRAEVDETINMLTGNLEKIAEHGRRADNIVKSMLEHSRGSSGERRTVGLNGLIEEALNLAYHGARAQDQTFNITLERDFAQGIAPIELVPQDITRVCLNLFTNGFYATTKRQREGGDASFKPTLSVSTRDLGDAVEIHVRDNGMGIPPEIKDKLFQPFFTTKPTGEGTGLGLSISCDIVTQQHGGAIEVDSRVGEYTEFTVRLPRRHRTILGEAAS